MYEIAAADLDRELRSADALGSRAATLLGFCGLILTLASALARDSLARDLGAVGRPVAAASLIAGIVVVIGAALLAASMITPRQRGRTNPAVMRSLRASADTETEIYGRLSKSMITLAGEEGAKNDQRGRVLRHAIRTVAVGLVLLAIQAVVTASTLF